MGSNKNKGFFSHFKEKLKGFRNKVEENAKEFGEEMEMGVKELKEGIKNTAREAKDTIEKTFDQELGEISHFIAEQKAKLERAFSSSISSTTKDFSRLFDKGEQHGDKMAEGLIVMMKSALNDDWSKFGEQGDKVLKELDGLFNDIDHISQRISHRLSGNTTVEELMAKFDRGDISFDDLENLDLIEELKRELNGVNHRIQKLSHTLNTEIKNQYGNEMNALKSGLAEFKSGFNDTIGKFSAEANTVKTHLREIKEKSVTKIAQIKVRRKLRKNLQQLEKDLQSYQTDPVWKKSLERIKELLSRNGVLTQQMYRAEIQDASALYSQLYAAENLPPQIQSALIEFSKLCIQYNNLNESLPVKLPATIKREREETREKLIANDLSIKAKNIFSAGTKAFRAAMSEKNKLVETKKQDFFAKLTDFFHDAKHKIENFFVAAAASVDAVKKESTLKVPPERLPHLNLLKLIGKAENMGVNLSQDIRAPHHANDSNYDPTGKIYCDPPHHIRDQKGAQIIYSHPNNEKLKLLALTETLVQLGELKERARTSNPQEYKKISTLEDKVWELVEHNGWDKDSGALHLLLQARSDEAKKNYQTAGRLRGIAMHLAKNVYQPDQANAEITLKNLTNVTSQYKSGWGKAIQRSLVRIMPTFLAKIGFEVTQTCHQAIKIEQRSNRVALPSNKRLRTNP